MTIRQNHILHAARHAIKSHRFNLTDEKTTQAEIFPFIQYLGFEKEYHLDSENIPDFFADGIAIEVKIKGQKAAIYRQLKRYSVFEEVHALILVSGRSMGLPGIINDKPCYYINLTRAYL